ncbi:hypothetical protein SCATT_p02290 (plasmid) [Streptantibioticus cattleyicolor NRRL 8057 = DSM 46488]|uniref:Uncharacterized protein n=1 Tax=Streptantibioticus cattleyicolor (strain ATCC 35852 / DSM 46488 / JCM 4925 / NBRC 14057 / NRRL 8057) TaxID=1003195 RepID=F8JKS7_STREN|nr:hypothetical protein SCATT_p02290 [Streptantibioticus cattleyicolor NRRL 8057 = DSM 46488]CCB72519.1 protein of unknown function [Streptantibioticus cattleyicolor NRRL 8057 = DSM 46488]
MPPPACPPTGTGLKAIDEIQPQGGPGARYADGRVPTWV